MCVTHDEGWQVNTGLPPFFFFFSLGKCKEIRSLKKERGERNVIWLTFFFTFPYTIITMRRNIQGKRQHSTAGWRVFRASSGSSSPSGVERGNLGELEPPDETWYRKNTCQTVARTRVTIKRAKAATLPLYPTQGPSAVYRAPVSICSFLLGAPLWSRRSVYIHTPPLEWMSITIQRWVVLAILCVYRTP